jgi:hypothetical protein
MNIPGFNAEIPLKANARASWSAEMLARRTLRTGAAVQGSTRHSFAPARRQATTGVFQANPLNRSGTAMPGFVGGVLVQDPSCPANYSATSCSAVCDSWDVVPSCDCNGYCYNTEDDCWNSQVDQNCGCSTPSTYCVHSHNVCCTETHGFCTGAGGADTCLTVGGITQTCHSNWLYGWYPYITICDDGTRQAGCKGPCY